MATPSALPRSSSQASNPPTGSVPPRRLKPLSTVSDSQRSASPSPSKLRPPTRPSLGGNAQSNSSMRSVSSTMTSNGADKSLRRSVSIAAFPQPPKSNGRLSMASISSSTSNVPSTARSTPDITKSATMKPRKQSRLSSGTTASNRSSKVVSLLDNSSDGKIVLNAAASRDSEGQFSISPPHSRSSSAQGSYSTSATTFDENEETEHDSRDSLAAGKKGARSKEAKGNVIVSVRVRPDTGANENPRAEGEWMVDGRRSLIAFRGKESYDYLYDNVFTAHDNNSKVYDASAKRLVRRVMEGYHGTVFAYGMTGTGKTFSMQGTASSPGVIPLAITDIFSYIRETPHREFLLRVSYLEIYNEKIHDLLSASSAGATGPNAPPQEEIKLREDSKRGVYATPLKEEIVQSPTQLLRVIARGDHARRTGSTQFNARSSRSHAVVQIVVESRERVPNGNSTQDKRSAVGPGGVRVSTLSLIDLAGSERAAENKERRTEGAHINKSLLTLGTVIARLSESKDKSASAADKESKHLPYRDTLSGNSLVSILCTIQIGASGSAAPANTHTNETLNTLKFAARAKNNIVSHAKRAEEAYGGNGDGGSRVLLERYRMEIQSLRAQLENQSKTQAENDMKMEEERMEKEAEARHEEQMLEMQLARTALKERIEHLNRLILSSKSTGVNSHGGTASFDRLSTMSGMNETRARSLYSSSSQSTLGANSLRRTVSQQSLHSTEPSNGYQFRRTSMAPDEDDDTVGEFGDGNASLQMQVTALQADLADKNRYISTLERRLLQARRSSHSRMSMGLAQLKNGDDADMMALLREKDMEISELRIQLDDKDRMLTALRSAARQRDVAQMTIDVPSQDKRFGGHQTNGSNASSLASPLSAGSSVNGLSLASISERETHPNRKSVDEVSRMLDEMIQDRVEQGHLNKTSRRSLLFASGTGNHPDPISPKPPAISVPDPRTSIVEVPENV
ncbi:kinesin family protein (KipA), putative [Talaromyces stipitatus ATCC 10500]|uniref:Kinesin-like protein n=1 Tax=Talaromyces stipitatus (strain ATCC 10500 / CBS 375.48 / QM 6759 / NRRL 1006) TaxID=441959 RepID=B8M0V5_TALSN|nr:kinesin family protein (KipA), putative [Talaromyces stipitatus ATCC 10500]EED21735.1 kinesin family protein (KipA), putative [Talaromyces stipitatus ATCC 10500]